MHSSRMRTAHFSGCLYLGGVYLWVEGGVVSTTLSFTTPQYTPFTTPLFTTPPVDRQTPVKTLPCPILRLRAVINTSMNSDKSFALMTTQPYIVHGLQNVGRPCSLTLIQRSSGAQLQLCCFSYNEVSRRSGSMSHFGLGKHRKYLDSFCHSHRSHFL